MRTKFIILTLLIGVFGYSQHPCSSIYGVDYNSFGTSALPYSFEELTSVYFKQAMCEGEYYKLEFWISKDLFMAKNKRDWLQYENAQLELRIFLAIKEGNREEGRNYKPIIYNLSSSHFVDFDPKTQRYKYKIYADAPYDLLTIGYKPISGWWGLDVNTIDDILNISSLHLNYIDRDTVVIEPKETEEIYNFDSLKITEFLDRKVKDKNVNIVNHDNFELLIFDDKVVDNDTVNIYLNGKAILNHYPLKKKALKLSIKLKEGMNTLLLYAENLGEIEPNTAAFHLVFEDKTYKKVLFSDFKTSDIIYLYYEK